MDLQQWQAKLAELVCQSRSVVDTKTDGWFAQAGSSHGLAMTRRIAASWAQPRLQQMCSLTFGMLGESARTELMERWLAFGLGCSPAFEFDADAVFDDLRAHTQESPHLRSLCELEMALRRAFQTREAIRAGHAQESTQVTRVRFGAPLHSVLSGALDGRWPQVEEKDFTVLVSPLFPGLWAVERQGHPVLPPLPASDMNRLA